MLLIGLVRGTLGWTEIRESLIQTAETSAMIFAILLGAEVFNAFLALTQVPSRPPRMIAASGWAPYTIMVGLLVFYIILGGVMDELAMILLTLPVFFPIVTALDFGMPADDVAIWFGILVLIVVGDRHDGAADWPQRLRRQLHRARRADHAHLQGRPPLRGGGRDPAGARGGVSGAGALAGLAWRECIRGCQTRPQRSGGEGNPAFAISESGSPSRACGAPGMTRRRSLRLAKSVGSECIAGPSPEPRWDWLSRRREGDGLEELAHAGARRLGQPLLCVADPLRLLGARRCRADQLVRARLQPQRLQERPLFQRSMHSSTRQPAPSPPERIEIDVGGEVRLARRGERIDEGMGPHRLQRVAEARLHMAVIEEER